MKTRKKIFFSFLIAIFSSYQVLAVTPSLPAGEFSEGQQPLAKKLYISPELGEIEDLYLSPNASHKASPLVVYVKDAHANYEAQKQIQRILTELYHNYGLGLLAVEGAGSPLKREYLEFYSDQKRNEKLVDYLARKGEVSGVDMFLLQEKRVEAYGIESVEAYASNLNAFRQVISEQSSSQRLMGYLEGQVELVMPRIFDKNLLKLVKLSSGFEKQQAELLTYVTLLAKEAEKSLQLDLGKASNQFEWPQIIRILRLKELEAKLDPKQIETDHSRILDLLKEINADAALIESFEALGNLKEAKKAKDASLNPRIVYEKLFNVASPKGFSFAKYGAFSTYAQYQILQHEISSKDLFDELEKLSDRLFEKLADTEEEKNLLLYMKDIRTLKKVLSLELLRGDMKDFVKRKNELMPERISERLNRFKEISRVKNHKEDISGTVTRLEPVLDSVIRFYELAQERESSLIANTLKIMREKKQTEAVMITGGYHMEGIKERLKRAGVSYVVITPRLLSLDKENHYTDVMMNRGSTIFETAQLAPVEKPQDPKILQLMAGNDTSRYVTLVILDAIVSETPEPQELIRALANPVFWGQIRSKIENDSNVPSGLRLFVGARGEEFVVPIEKTTTRTVAEEVKYRVVPSRAAGQAESIMEEPPLAAASLGIELGDLPDRLKQVLEGLQKDPVNFGLPAVSKLYDDLNIRASENTGREEFLKMLIEQDLLEVFGEILKAVDLQDDKTKRLPVWVGIALPSKRLQSAFLPFFNDSLRELRTRLAAVNRELERGKLAEALLGLRNLIQNARYFPQTEPFKTAFFRFISSEKYSDILTDFESIFSKIPRDFTEVQNAFVGFRPEKVPSSEFVNDLNALRFLLIPSRENDFEERFISLVDEAVKGLQRDNPDWSPLIRLLNDRTVIGQDVEVTSQLKELLRGVADDKLLRSLQDLDLELTRIRQVLIGFGKGGTSPANPPQMFGKEELARLNYFLLYLARNYSFKERLTASGVKDLILNLERVLQDIGRSSTSNQLLLHFALSLVQGGERGIAPYLAIGPFVLPLQQVLILAQVEVDRLIAQKETPESVGLPATADFQKIRKDLKLLADFVSSVPEPGLLKPVVAESEIPDLTALTQRAVDGLKRDTPTLLPLNQLLNRPEIFTTSKDGVIPEFVDLLKRDPRLVELLDLVIQIGQVKLPKLIALSLPPEELELPKTISPENFIRPLNLLAAVLLEVPRKPETPAQILDLIRLVDETQKGLNRTTPNLNPLVQLLNSPQIFTQQEISAALSPEFVSLIAGPEALRPLVEALQNLVSTLELKLPGLLSPTTRPEQIGLPGTVKIEEILRRFELVRQELSKVPASTAEISGQKTLSVETVPVPPVVPSVTAPKGIAQDLKDLSDQVDQVTRVLAQTPADLTPVIDLLKRPEFILEGKVEGTGSNRLQLAPQLQALIDTPEAKQVFLSALVRLDETVGSAFPELVASPVVPSETAKSESLESLRQQLVSLMEAVRSVSPGTAVLSLKEIAELIALVEKARKGLGSSPVRLLPLADFLTAPGVFDGQGVVNILLVNTLQVPGVTALSGNTALPLNGPLTTSAVRPAVNANIPGAVPSSESGLGDNAAVNLTVLQNTTLTVEDIRLLLLNTLQKVVKTAQVQIPQLIELIAAGTFSEQQSDLPQSITLESLSVRLQDLAELLARSPLTPEAAASLTEAVPLLPSAAQLPQRLTELQVLIDRAVQSFDQEPLNLIALNELLNTPEILTLIPSGFAVSPELQALTTPSANLNIPEESRLRLVESLRDLVTVAQNQLAQLIRTELPSEEFGLPAAIRLEVLGERLSVLSSFVTATIATSFPNLSTTPGEGEMPDVPPAPSSLVGEQRTVSPVSLPDQIALVPENVQELIAVVSLKSETLKTAPRVLTPLVELLDLLEIPADHSSANLRIAALLQTDFPQRIVLIDSLRQLLAVAQQLVIDSLNDPFSAVSSEPTVLRELRSRLDLLQQVVSSIPSVTGTTQNNFYQGINTGALSVAPANLANILPLVNRSRVELTQEKPLLTALAELLGLPDVVEENAISSKLLALATSPDLDLELLSPLIQVLELASEILPQQIEANTPAVLLGLSENTPSLIQLQSTITNIFQVLSSIEKNVPATPVSLGLSGRIPATQEAIAQAFQAASAAISRTPFDLGRVDQLVVLPELFNSDNTLTPSFVSLLTPGSPVTESVRDFIRSAEKILPDIKRAEKTGTIPENIVLPENFSLTDIVQRLEVIVALGPQLPAPVSLSSATTSTLGSVNVGKIPDFGFVSPESLPLSVETVVQLAERINTFDLKAKTNETAVADTENFSVVIPQIAELVSLVFPFSGTPEEFENQVIEPLVNATLITPFREALAKAQTLVTLPGLNEQLPETILIPGGTTSPETLKENLLTLIELLKSTAVAPTSPAEIPGIVQDLISLLGQIPALVQDLASQTQPLPSAETAEIPSSQTGPILASIGKLADARENLIDDLNRLSRAESLPAQVREETRKLTRSVESVNPPSLVVLAEEPTPVLLVQPQLANVQESINQLLTLLPALPPLLQSVIALPGIPGLPSGANVPGLDLPIKNVEIVRPPERLPEFPASFAAALPRGVQFLRKTTGERKVTLADILEVIKVTEGLVEPGFDRTLAILLIELALPELQISRQLFSSGYLTVKESEFLELMIKVYGPMLSVDRIHAGAVIYNFENVLPTQEQLSAITFPLKAKTKLYVRVVLYEEGLDQKKVEEMRTWLRSRLDMNGNPVGDRFDFVVTPEDKAQEFISGLHLLRRPGKDERTLFELVRNAGPDQIKTQTDFFRHAVYYGEQPIMVDLKNLSDQAWLVFSRFGVTGEKFWKVLPYAAIKLAGAALLRDQMPDEDQREFKKQGNLRQFNPNAAALAQFLSTWAANMRKLLVAA